MLSNQKFYLKYILKFDILFLLLHCSLIWCDMVNIFKLKIYTCTTCKKPNKNLKNTKAQPYRKTHLPKIIKRRTCFYIWGNVNWISWLLRCCQSVNYLSTAKSIIFKTYTQVLRRDHIIVYMLCMTRGANIYDLRAPYLLVSNQFPNLYNFI